MSDYSPTRAIAARLEAEARCRKDGGPLSVVRYWAAGRLLEEELSPYGALALAKSLVSNGYRDVELILSDGSKLDVAAIRAARY